MQRHKNRSRSSQLMSQLCHSTVPLLTLCELQQETETLCTSASHSLALYKSTHCLQQIRIKKENQTGLRSPLEKHNTHLLLHVSLSDLAVFSLLNGSRLETTVATTALQLRKRFLPRPAVPPNAETPPVPLFSQEGRELASGRNCGGTMFLFIPPSPQSLVSTS